MAGERVKCTQCGAQWNLEGQQRIITTQALHKACKGAALKGSPPLSEFFKKKDTPGSGSQEATTSQPEEGKTRPTPKRLHFSTELDEQEALHQQFAALAMNPSLSAATVETAPASENRAEATEHQLVDLDEDAQFTVDDF